MGSRKRVMLAAPKSGSGKTLLTLALLSALKQRGLSPRAFKCGPDYIDPMFHRRAMAIESQNLDSFFLEKEALSGTFHRTLQEGRQDVSVIEGVMGLYDGLGGTSEAASSYEIACFTDTPIILVVDGKGMGRSVLAELAGFLYYDREKRIRGVIFNRVSEGFYQVLKPLVAAEFPSLSLLGCFPEQEELRFSSRHLGLKTPGEIEELSEKLKRAGQQLLQYVSLDGILRLAEEAVGEAEEKQEEGKLYETDRSRTLPQPFEKAEEIALPKARQDAASPEKIRIAVARDEAFCFYYPENLKILEELGAEIAYFSPLREEKLPDGCSGLILGGGYPELYLPMLEKNQKMQQAIRSAIEKGMPSLAECGGFLYLHEGMEDTAGRKYSMVGLIPGIARYQGKLVRFGYGAFREKAPRFLPAGEEIRGHEFHYYDSSCNGDAVIGRKPTGSRSWECVLETENSFWGFPHLYYPSNPHFPRHFVEMARRFSERKPSCHGKLISFF